MKSTSGDYLYSVPQVFGTVTDLSVRLFGLQREEVSFDREEFGSSIGLRRHLEPLQADAAVRYQFESVSADITVHDKAVIVTGTIPQGGDTFTELIAKKLKVSTEEAHVIKTKYGIGKSKKQSELLEVVRPSIDQLAKEIRRMIRYHEERSGSEQKIGQVVTMGGGANMPGLSELLTDTIRLPVRTCEPWHNLKLGNLKSPNTYEKSLYVTVAGLSLINSKELFS
mgnify:CR=1 FL=1